MFHPWARLSGLPEKGECPWESRCYNVGLAEKALIKQTISLWLKKGGLKRGCWNSRAGLLPGFIWGIFFFRNAKKEEGRRVGLPLSRPRNLCSGGKCRLFFGLLGSGMLPGAERGPWSDLPDPVPGKRPPPSGIFQWTEDRRQIQMNLHRVLVYSLLVNMPRIKNRSPATKSRIYRGMVTI